MNIKRLWRLYREFALSIALLVFSVIGSFVGIFPVMRSSLATLTVMQKLEARIGLLSAKQRLLDALDEANVRQNLQILLSGVPRDKDLPSIFETMDSVISQSGLSPIDMTIANPGSLATEAATRQTSEEKQIGSSFLSFTVTLQGSPNNFRDFLQKVISIRRLLRVRSFGAVVTNDGSAQIHVDLDAFYSPLPKTIGSIDQPILPATSEDNAVLEKLAAYPWPSQSISISPPTVGSGRTNPFSQ